MWVVIFCISLSHILVYTRVDKLRIVLSFMKILILLRSRNSLPDFKKRAPEWFQPQIRKIN